MRLALLLTLPAACWAASSLFTRLFTRDAAEPVPLPPICPGRPRRLLGSVATESGRVRTWITLPRLGSCPSSLAESPLSAVVFSPGFNAPQIFYFPYADALARAGFAVIQPSRSFGMPPPEMEEVSWLPALIEWAQGYHPAGINATHLRTAGHSKGGNIAALQHAINPDVVASFLIDPVACGIEFAPCLADAADVSSPYIYGPAFFEGQLSAIAAAGVIGSANEALCICPDGWESTCPPDTAGLCERLAEAPQSARFYNATAPGSARFTIVEADHGSFLSQPTANLTITLMLSWFTHAATDEWLAAKQQQGSIVVDRRVE